MNVLPLFYPRKAKNAVTCSVTTFREILKVVPPVLLKLNFNQTDFIELITNTLCIKHFLILLNTA